MLVTVLRILGVLILIGGVSLGIIIGLAPMVTSAVGSDAAGQAFIPPGLISQAAAFVGLIIAGISLTTGVDFLTRAAMLQSSINIEAQLKQVEDLLKRRPNA